MMQIITEEKIYMYDGVNKPSGMVLKEPLITGGRGPYMWHPNVAERGNKHLFSAKDLREMADILDAQNRKV